MEKIIIPARPAAPIACDMTDASDTPEERLAEYRKLFEQALVTRERLEGDPGPDGQTGSRGLRFTFADKPGVQEWLADLVRREAACCAFLSYRVEVDAGANQIVWTITNEADDAVARAILDDFFAAAGQVDVGIG